MTDAVKWRHYESEIILTCVRWYLRYALSYRDMEFFDPTLSMPNVLRKALLPCLDGSQSDMSQFWIA